MQTIIGAVAETPEGLFWPWISDRMANFASKDSATQWRGHQLALELIGRQPRWCLRFLPWSLPRSSCFNLGNIYVYCTSIWICFLLAQPLYHHLTAFMISGLGVHRAVEPFCVHSSFLLHVRMSSSRGVEAHLSDRCCRVTLILSLEKLPVASLPPPPPPPPRPPICFGQWD